MILETSRQARFLIPMAISLGFGILFATFIALVMVPCLYLVLEDIKRWMGRWFQEISFLLYRDPRRDSEVKIKEIA